jgi:hypothetical protein
MAHMHMVNQLENDEHESTRLFDFSILKNGICLHKFHVTNHLSMKEGGLFCFVVMRSIELGCFRSSSLCPWKALDEEGLEVQKFLKIE